MAFKQRGYSDERLKNYDMELNLLLKSLGGGLIVTCPCCGHQFDYDNEPEHTFSQEVQDAASEFVSSIARNEACRRIEHYRPEIQAAVSSIIDGMAATKKEITTKSIVDAFAYVRCPHCWSRVYRSNNILVADPSTPNEVKEKKPEDEEGKKDDDTKKKSADVPTPSPSSSFWASLNAATKK